ncbi:MAG: 6-carboxytetrahydropterin synthase [bacterium]|nr:6-carboxytetrahydropterin synthase [bacterium]
MSAQVTVKVFFEAAHRLHNPAMDDVWNASTFGKCNNSYGHGHNYALEVTVEGDIDPVSGFLIDMKELKRLVNETIVAEVDHRHLNHEVRWLEGINPTAENLARVFYQRLGPKLPQGIRLAKLTVHETDRNSASWVG